MTENDKLCIWNYDKSDCEGSKGQNCEWILEKHVPTATANDSNKPAITAVCDEKPRINVIVGVCTHQNSQNKNCEVIYGCKLLNFEDECNKKDGECFWQHPFYAA